MSGSADLQRYAVWGVMVLLGGVLAFGDRRFVALALLVLVALGGIVVSWASPFTFQGGDHYMQGVIATGGAALALAGYAVVFIFKLVRARMSGGRTQ